jgi:hypothetical protein
MLFENIQRFEPPIIEAVRVFGFEFNESRLMALDTPVDSIQDRSKSINGSL